MTWTKMLQQAIDYMEEHLLDDINYEDVARELYISTYEFHRTFSIMTGMTANAYIRNRRLSLAGRELQEEDKKVIDIALKYGYDTPESFTKAFIRFHGVAPKYAKYPGTRLCLFNPLKIKVIMEGGKSMNYRMEEKAGQSFLCLKKAFLNEIINEEGNHDIPDFWDDCIEKKCLKAMEILRPEGKQDFYGLCSPTTESSKTFDYGIGILMDEETTKIDFEEWEQMGYSIWNTTPQQYVVFECMGKDGECIGEAWNRFFKEFVPQTGYQPTDGTDYELYLDQGKEGLFCELWIPVCKE